jgi:hypothetical protein
MDVSAVHRPGSVAGGDNYYNRRRIRAIVAGDHHDQK